MTSPAEQDQNHESDVGPPSKRRKANFGNGFLRSEEMQAEESYIDESLYSRQLYVLGHDAMKRMGMTRILIAGMKGLGVEIAKNVILAGVKSVTLQDTQHCKISDLSSQYYLKESDVGKNRAEACRGHLMELNSYVRVDSHTGPLTQEFLSQFHVVVLTDSTLEEVGTISSFTHSSNIKLIMCCTRGLAGQIFCDFGADFVVEDVNGENPASVMISNLERDGKVAIVNCLDEHRHNFEDGSYAVLTDVKEIPELNGGEPKRISVISPFSFSYEDCSPPGDYIISGYAVQVKMPKTLHFKSFKEAVMEPVFVESDFAKLGRASQLHLGFTALQVFQKCHDRLPRPYNQEDAEEFLRIAEKINGLEVAKVDEVDTRLLERFVYQSRGDLCPMQSVIGGFAGQEVMKACSGKFTPIVQWFYFDAFECLAEDGVQPSEMQCTPRDSRYDAQTAVFGEAFQNKLGAQKYFMVGSGAIGCELLKNFAMMGLACGPSGYLYVTDMDTIERSNLNRQFLFRPADIQRPKSDVAAGAVKVMNPHINIIAHQNKVGPETESVYSEDFMSALDGVANALDNIEARTYMDRRCVYSLKPLLESGTQGTKGNVQVVIPHLTETYSSSHDPPEKAIPICTLKNFPYAIEHTLQWARELFEGFFIQPLEMYNMYLSDPEFMNRLALSPFCQQVDNLNSIIKVYRDRPRDFRDCVVWARQVFEENYANTIHQLLYNFPPNQTTSTGQPFWTPPKRAPHPLVFSVDESTHLDFVIAAANLRAKNYSIPACRDRELVCQMAAAISLPKFVPKSGLKIAANEQEMQQMMQARSEDADLEEVKQSLPSIDETQKLCVTPLEFEKDDDTNFHMDFIVACSNLRAMNYNIPLADRMKSKLIAGKIIPAIATTTALVAGLVCLELYKLVMGHKKLESYKNGFINLALPFIGFSEPIRAPKMKYRDTEFTLWDRLEINGVLPDGSEMTIQDLIDHIRNGYNLEINMISCGVSIMFSFFMAPARKTVRLKERVSEVMVKLLRKKIEHHVRAIVLEPSCADTDGEDVEFPFIVYKFPESSYLLEP